MYHPRQVWRFAAERTIDGPLASIAEIEAEAAFGNGKLLPELEKITGGDICRS